MMMASGFGVSITPEAIEGLRTMAATAMTTRVEDRDGAGRTEPAAGKPEQAFARLAGLVASNDRCFAEMKGLDARLAEALTYLASPSANVRLGRACLDRVRASRSRVLAVLRANRLAAREFLAS